MAAEGSTTVLRLENLDNSRSAPATDVSEWDSEEAANVATVEPVPPDGKYGWVCTFAVFMINAHTWGVNAVSL